MRRPAKNRSVFILSDKFLYQRVQTLTLKRLRRSRVLYFIGAGSSVGLWLNHRQAAGVSRAGTERFLMIQAGGETGLNVEKPLESRPTDGTREGRGVRHVRSNVIAE